MVLDTPLRTMLVKLDGKNDNDFERCVDAMGEVWALEADDGRLDSVIALLPPGKSLSDAPSAQENWDKFTSTIGQQDSATLSESVTYQRPGYTVDDIDQSWNISLIGTRPSAAGRGLGTKLIQFGIDKAQPEKRGIWVPTTHAPRMRFYEKHDFIHVQTKSAINPFGERAEEYVMLRPV